MSQGASARNLWPSAGIFLGPAAWVLNTQLNYAIVPWVCLHGAKVVLAITVANALVAVGGGVLSWRSWSPRAIRAGADPHGGRPHQFAAGIGTLIAALFAAVILLQGAAGLVLQGCER